MIKIMNYEICTNKKKSAWQNKKIQEDDEK